MIRRHNRTQLLYAALLCCGSLVLSGIIYWVFATHLARDFFGSFWSVSPTAARGVGVAGVCLCFTAGYLLWKNDGGLEAYRESLRKRYWRDPTSNDDLDSILFVPAAFDTLFILQIIRSAPRWMFMAYARLKFCLPDDSALNASLEKTFEKIKTAARWQGPQDYPGKLKEILHLVEMGLLDYSDFNGKQRFKVR